MAFLATDELLGKADTKLEAGQSSSAHAATLDEVKPFSSIDRSTNLAPVNSQLEETAIFPPPTEQESAPCYT